MKTQHITLLGMMAAAFASCSPSTSPSATGGEVPAPMIAGMDKVPTGHPDPQGRPNMVVSPYRPYNIINVKGYRSGSIVGDPSTAKVNPATGKLDLSTSKHFRIP